MVAKAGVSWNRKLSSVIVALLPWLECFRIPFLNIGLGMGLLALLGVFSLPYIVSTRKPIVSINVLIIMCIYFVFRSIDSIKNMVVWITLSITLMGIAKSPLDFLLIKKTIRAFAYINIVAMLFQYMAHYLFHTDVYFVFKQLLNEHMLVSDMSGVASLFRPSGFFLEPSFFAQYCSVALIFALFPPTDGEKVEMGTAIILTAGVLLTTSGMGIVIVGCAFASFIVFSSRIKTHSKIIMGVGFIVVGILLLRIPFINTSFQRIVGKVEGYNAINGRIGMNGFVLKKLSFFEKVMGLGSTAEPGYYITGWTQCVYCYGYIGVICMALLMLNIWLKRCKTAFFIIAIYGCLMFVSNLMSVNSMLYFVGISLSTIAYKQRVEK